MIVNRSGIKKIIVSGETSQLGQEIKILSSTDKNDFSFTSRKDFDLSNKSKMKKYFINNSFDIFINCAAYTNVEGAESDFVMANKINNEAVRYLAELCKKHRVLLIHISTDYVFDGKSRKPYDEDSPCNPINMYGISKYKGELAIEEVGPSAIIIRTSWLYSSHGQNFVSKIIDKSKLTNIIKVVDDQTGSPTYARDLAAAIIKITDTIKTENYSGRLDFFHYSNDGSCSWYDFASEILNILDSSCNIERITTEQLTSKLRRPRKIIMNTSKIKNTFNITIPNWDNSLTEFLLQAKN